MNNSEEFSLAWEKLDDPKAIEAAMSDDQQALAEREVYRTPDGLYFEVSRKLDCGTVVTDSGLWISPEGFAECERYL